MKVKAKQCVVVVVAVMVLLMLMAFRRFSFRLHFSAEKEQGHFPDPTRKEQGHFPDSKLMIDDTVARDLQSRVRVMCAIFSVPKQLDKQAKAVNRTWAPRCNDHIFFMEGEGPFPRDVVSLDIPTGYVNLTAKTVGVYTHMYNHHLHDFDWFLKADDDAYVVVENLRHLLSSYDPDSPVYIGHLYKRGHPEGFMSGGASYALSRGALRALVEVGFQKEGKCRLRGGREDVEMGRCMHSAGVHSFNTRDRYGRDSFHPLSPFVHIVGPIPENQIPQDRFLMVSGHACCSQLTISFHKVRHDLMYLMDHLLYRTTVFGRQPDMSALDHLVPSGSVPPPT